MMVSQKLLILGVDRNYWSATTKSNNTANAWNVDLANGNTNNNNKNNPNNTVRCVRALPPPALGLIGGNILQIMETIFTLQKIYKAYRDCIKGKKNTTNALSFEVYREKNLPALLTELQNRTYKISRYIYFIVTEPSTREIFAADFRDRVVHHLLYNEIRPIFEATFIEHSYANRVGKGTHAAVRQLCQDMRYTNRFGDGWCLKLDVRSFFRSIDKNILYSLIKDRIDAVMREEKVWYDEILWLCRRVIFHDPTSNYIYKGRLCLKSLIPKSKSLFFSRGTGVPIGNLTSQFFANIYLNELDQFITKWLGCTRYVRYVDDFVMMDEDKDKLNLYIRQIDNFLIVTLNLHIHPRKIYLQPALHGIDFLGYFIKPTHTLVRQSVVRRFKDKLYHRRNQNDGLFSVDDIPMIKSYLGHFGHANTYNLREHLSH